MTLRGTSAALLASLAVAGMLSAPVTQARPTCQEAGTNTVCGTRGHVSIKARPGTTAPPGNMTAQGRGTRGAGAGGGGR